MTPDPNPPDADQVSLAAYRTLCVRDGIDPDIELATVRLAANIPAGEWAAAVLAAHHLQADRPTIDTFDLPALAWLAWDRPNPAALHALSAPAAAHALVDCYQLAGWAPTWLCDRLATNPTTRIVAIRAARTSRAVRQQLAQDPERLIREHVALSPSTPRDMVVALVDDPEHVVQACAIRYSHLPVERLRGLRRHPDERVALEAARALHELAQLESKVTSTNPKDRAETAVRTYTPPRLLAVLARDPDPEVRSWVARLQRLPEPLARILARDSARQVRALLAANTMAPDPLAAALAADPEPNVALVARHRVERLARLDPGPTVTLT